MEKANQSIDDFPAQVGDLYSRWTLDGLIEVGYAISLDFIARPQLYQSQDIPDVIVPFRMECGTETKFPNTAQRQAMVWPILGRTDWLKPDASTTSSPFHVARKKLIDACIAFSERAVETGVSMLEDRVRSALIPIRAYFDGLRGKSVRLTYQHQIKAVSDTANSLFLAAGVARVFGVVPADANWPLDSSDPNGAKLVEAAGTALNLPSDYKFGYTKFILLQRVALEGGRALALVLTADDNTEYHLKSIISHCYTWGTSLRDFQQTP